MRVVERLPASEILKLLDKQWLTTNDIRQIASVGLANAIKIKNKIINKILEKDKNYFLPKGLVPTSEVVDYLHLDIKYLKKISNSRGE